MTTCDTVETLAAASAALGLYRGARLQDCRGLTTLSLDVAPPAIDD